MSNNSHTFKLVDGYALNATDGYSYTTNWVDVHDCNKFSVNVVFTGGTPVGTLALQQSNDRQTSLPGSVIRMVDSVGDNSAGTTKRVDDAVSVPAGTGQTTASVTAAGVYVLNQYFAPFRWFRVVYTASSSINTQLDMFVHLKK